jgi:hypothetical protein
MPDENSRQFQHSQAPLAALERKYSEAYEREAREQFGDHWISPNVLKNLSPESDSNPWTDEQKEAQGQHAIVMKYLNVRALYDPDLASVIEQLGEERAAKAAADAEQARIEREARAEEERQAKEATAARLKAEDEAAVKRNKEKRAALERAGWIRIPQMVGIVLGRHNVSIGRAEKLVRDAIASGDVRPYSERHPEYHSKDDFIYWLDQQPLDKRKNEALTTPAPPEQRQQQGRRRGRKPSHDWPAMKNHALELLKERGDPEEEDQVEGWRSQTDMAEAIQARMKEPKPDLSTVIKYAVRWLAEWRENCAQASNN